MKQGIHAMIELEHCIELEQLDYEQEVMKGGCSNMQ
jgi:hypothetical protein